MENTTMSCHLGSLSSPRHMTYFRLDDKFHKNIYLGQTRPWQTTFQNQHTCKVKSYNVQRLFSALRSTLVIINFTMSNTLAEHLLTIGQIMNNSTHVFIALLDLINGGYECIPWNRIHSTKSDFQLSEGNPKPKLSVWPIAKDTGNSMNQSKFKANTWCRAKRTELLTKPESLNYALFFVSLQKWFIIKTKQDWWL